MNTMCCASLAPVPASAPAPAPQRRAGLAVWRAWLARRRSAPGLSPADYAALSHLSESTLRDIGAPDWVHAPDRGALLWTLERMRW